MLFPVNPVDTIQRQHGIVGRAEELAMSLAVLSCGRHLLLEGPVGVGKTTVALAVCGHLGRSVVRVDGDDRYSESKLTGWFDPPLVLAKGYSDETFFAGPLVQAMRDGGVLFINELNRMPEAVQNVLLPALDEHLLIVPRIGEVRAAEGFQVVATQNPVEYIATGHLSEALEGPLRARRARLSGRRRGDRDRDSRDRLPRCRPGAPRLWRSPARHGPTRVSARGRRCGRRSPWWRSPPAPTAPTPAPGRPRCAAHSRGAARRGGDAARLCARRPHGGSGGPKKSLTAVGAAPRPPAVTLVGLTSRPSPAANVGKLPDGEAQVMLAERLGVEPDAIDGWDVATKLSSTGFDFGDRELKEYARRIAAAAVLRRAWQLVGPIRRATRPVVSVMDEPYRGELELDATLENIAGKRFPEREDWIVERREDREQQVVVMMDASLSMAGENLAVAAVAAAVLALKLRSEDVSIVAFESTARALSHLEERDDPEVVVERLLVRAGPGLYQHPAGPADRRRGDPPRTQPAQGRPAYHRRRLHRRRRPDALMPKRSRVSSCCSPRTTRWTRRCANGSRGSGGARCSASSAMGSCPAKMLEIANRVLR